MTGSITIQWWDRAALRAKPPLLAHQNGPIQPAIKQDSERSLEVEQQVAIKY